MPTEELFGAYHFLLEADSGKSADSFDFKAKGGEAEAAMLLPAVQAAREAARRSEAEEPAEALQIADAPSEPMIVGLLLPAVQTATAEPTGALHHDNWTENSAVAGDHKEWIDILSLDQGASRSDGGDDFMF